MADVRLMSEKDLPEEDVYPETTGSPGEDTFGFGNELELNPFDGLPFSSRYYTLLKERKTLPVWRARTQFVDSLINNQFVVVSGVAKTGKSTQIPHWCAEFCLSTQYQHGMVVCTQILRQQAIDLALRVADEMDVNIGHEVGYTIPLETCCSSDTVLRFCTDKMLLREMMSDPLLERYGAIIIDQAHARSVSTDLLLGLLKGILLQRPELRVVVLTVPPMTDKLLSHFGMVPVISLETECLAEVVYSSNSSNNKDYFYSAMRLVLEIHRTKEEGDIAVFLASEREVECAQTILQKESTRLGAELGQMVTLALCPGPGGSLPIPAEGSDSRWSRRVFLSIQQGEEVLWAMGSVNFVIDTGIEKRLVYNPRIRANSEVTRPISRCQADIRKQLAGPKDELNFYACFEAHNLNPVTAAECPPEEVDLQMTEADVNKTFKRVKARKAAGPDGIPSLCPQGKCFCLYPEETRLPEAIPPQILESNITSTVLLLKRMEIAGLGPCDFMDRPDPECLMQALEELDYLAALDNDGNLSEIGIIISEFPLDPQMAKALLASCEFDCVSEMLTITAMLSAPSCYQEQPDGFTSEAVQWQRKFQHPEGDHFTLINIYNAFIQSQRENLCVDKWCQEHFLDLSALKTAEAIRSELTDILNRIELPISEPTFGTNTNAQNIKRALLSGFFMQIARDVDGSGNYFMLTHKHMAQVHPFSCYGAKAHKVGLPEWVVFHEYTLSESNCMRIVSEISPEVFIQVAPQYFFYNLPPSESKDILQNILDPDESETCKGTEQEASTSTSDGNDDCEAAEQSYDRCVIQ